jgi:hypothetical protein
LEASNFLAASTIGDFLEDFATSGPNHGFLERVISHPASASQTKIAVNATHAGAEAKRIRSQTPPRRGSRGPCLASGNEIKNAFEIEKATTAQLSRFPEGGTSD